MSFFRVTDEQARELATEYACALDRSPEASALRRQADQDDGLGMHDSAAALRALADVRNEDAQPA